MNQAQWRRELGEIVRNAMRSPEIEHYFKVKITKAGAQALDHAARTVHSPSARLLGACLGQLPAHVGEAKNSAA